MTDTPPPAGGIDSESLAEYLRWLNSLNGIGPVLAERIIESYPDYFELASSSSSQIADRVKGLSESAAKSILHTIAAETMKAGAPASTEGEQTKQADSITRVSDVESEEVFEDTVTNESDETVNSNEEEEIGFLSHPLDFKPVMEAKKHTPISIDALKEQHMAQQSAAGLRPGSDYKAEKGSGDFVAYRKPKKNPLASDDAPIAQPQKRRAILLPVFLILVGLALVGYSITTLWESDQPNGSSTTKDPLVKFLTFDFLKKDAPTDQTTEPPISTALDSPPIVATPDVLDLGTEETTELPEETPTVEEPIEEEEPDVVVIPEPEPEPEPEPVVINASDVSVSVLNGSGVTGAAGSGAAVLRDAGYTVTTTGNANNYAYDQTTVFFTGDNLPKAEKVLSDLSGDYDPKLGEGAYTGQTTDVVVVIGSR